MIKYLAGLWLLCTSTFANAQETGTVILLVDISSSISTEQMKLQMDSYASVLQFVASVRNKRVIPIVFSVESEVLSNGTYTDAINAFASYPILRPEFRGHTCLSSALIRVERMLPNLPTPIVLDISGDGEANCSTSGSIPDILDRMAEDYNVQVNTLYIENDLPNSTRGYDYYKSLTRNSGFIMSVETFMDFELSLFEKLVMEVSWLDMNN
jgi:uncharacterized protein with von Willebrand factor type A (vWA) domain